MQISNIIWSIYQKWNDIGKWSFSLFPEAKCDHFERFVSVLQTTPQKDTKLKHVIFTEQYSQHFDRLLTLATKMFLYFPNISTTFGPSKQFHSSTQINYTIDARVDSDSKFNISDDYQNVLILPPFSDTLTWKSTMHHDAWRWMETYSCEYCDRSLHKII